MARQKPTQASEVDALVQAASELYQQGRFDEARAKTAQAKILSPNDFRPYGIAGLAWLAQWKMKNASAEFATVIRLQPQLTAFYLLKAKADISLGAVDLAKLRQLDAALAKEMEEYRRTYEGGLIAEPIKE